ncbi:hypothetical protein ABI59_10445 [Acidobacteria bacterium Mor1]|nr:hypothetical protein ABI59_10445 [Acidobacteria bacterium Mor1]
MSGPEGNPGRPASLVDGLNPDQQAAVLHGDGPLLVLAGAGSGKTRVITHRVAHLILERRVSSFRIFAVTFTNKAAGEMKERIERLLGGTRLDGWVGTFHSLCLRILRRHAVEAGLQSGFNIYDSADQLAVVKRILKEVLGEDDSDPPRTFLSKISRAKNAMETPEELAKHPNPARKLVAEVYGRYEEALRQANAVDFDDLLLRTVRLLHENEQVRAIYAERCEHLLVDEYQDTNRPQYLLVKALSSHHGNVCVVGDEDQSIYRFRGAELRNILDFERDHPGTVTIRLEQNYRSTRNILAAAGAVVSRNLSRKGKTLWTENNHGDPLELASLPEDRAEATWIVRRIRQLTDAYETGQMAVLYRTNAQSRQLEEAFRRERIPFRIVGSLQFYDRREVKDVLAYLKLALNPSDDVAFRRVVNTPARGIGATTLEKLETIARGYDSNLLDAARRALEGSLIGGRAIKQLAGFVELIDDLAGRRDDQGVAELIEHVVKTVDYEPYLEKLFAGVAQERIENVRSLITAAVEFAEDEENPTLEGFLDRSALVADTDDLGKGEGVTLMTIHCAKGLEFPVVFLVGLEENLFPHSMAGDREEDIEEERRLCYVAMTRAERKLLLSYSAYRRMHGMFMPAYPSRFLAEIPRELIESVDPGPLETHEPTPAYSGSSAARAAARRRPAASPAQPRKPSGPPPEDGYAVGALVEHPVFGTGKIHAREGSGRSLRLVIVFVSHGKKRIVPAYTKLTVRG